ncbi:MAG: AMP-binding protein [Alphaproteobacteria bacterium]|nr:AMP-binding protein [Alphaproteobacteria bacterium]
MSPSLWSLIVRAGMRPDRAFSDPEHNIPLEMLSTATSLECGLGEFLGRSVLLATADQLPAALALIELDGIARRIVVCPGDVAAEHLPALAETAEVDLVVTDEGRASAGFPAGLRVVQCASRLHAAATSRTEHSGTEWVLLTSGTTGVPKLVVHSLASLAAPIKQGGPAASFAPVWSTFYDIRRYGGMQIFLRAALGSGTLVLSSAREPVAEFLARAGRHGITHISGTPSHWRRALMNPGAARISPRYVRLSGEIPDQPILKDLKTFYQSAAVGHAFASTEAGVAFEVNDALAGFPADLLDRHGGEVEMTLAQGSLRIRSPRTATRYLGNVGPLRDENGFVDTGDVVEERNGRCFFVGRRGGIINVGGLKVHPEEVEAVINHHPAVRMSLAKARKNPFTGAVVVADIVMRSAGAESGDTTDLVRGEVLDICRRSLAPHKVPAAIRFVSSLDVGATGKLARRSA